MWTLAGQLGQTNLVVLTIGAGSYFVCLLLGEQLLSRSPGGPLCGRIGDLTVSVAGLAQHGVSIVGALPRRIARIGLAIACGFAMWMGFCLWPPRAFFWAYVESVSAARTLAARHGYDIDPRQELLALGVANLAGGI